MQFDPSVRKSVEFANKLAEEQGKMSFDAPIPVIEMREAMEPELAKRLHKVVSEEATKHPNKSFWVQVFLWKDMERETVVRQMIQCRWTKPEPQPSTQVYYFDHTRDYIDLRWTLPPPYSMAKIQAMPKDYDNKLVKWVQAYACGNLRAFN